MNQLDFDYFKLTQKTIIYNSDLGNLRKLYSPILNHLSILLYEYLNDLAKTNKQETPFSFSLLTLLLNTNEANLHTSRLELEALGLINTYKDLNNSMIIFELHKPLNSLELTKNPFISQMVKQKIGEINFKRITTEQNKVSINKFMFEDISANFFNIFQANLNNSKEIMKNFYLESGSKQVSQDEIKSIVKKKEIYTPLEIANIKYANHYQAIMQLNTLAFIKQMFNNNEFELSESILNTWTKVFIDSKTLNLVIYFSLKRRSGANWYKYTNSLIAELTSRKLTKFDEIENYLDGKFKNNIRTRSIYDEKVVLKNDYYKGLKNV